MALIPYETVCYLKQNDMPVQDPNEHQIGYGKIMLEEKKMERYKIFIKEIEQYKRFPYASPRKHF